MADINKVLKTHRLCMDILLQYHEKDDNFFFVPRRRSRSNRSRDTYYFLGDDCNYLIISFWDGGDSKEKIHNISFGIDLNKDEYYIEISSTDNEQKAEYLCELVNVLESSCSIIFKKLDTRNKWYYTYPKTMKLEDALDSFIINEKPVIDQFVQSNLNMDIKMLDFKFFKKYVIDFFRIEKDIWKDKKTVGTFVSKTEYFMQQKHSDLQNKMIKYLKNKFGENNVFGERDNVDVMVITEGGEKIFYEIKTCCTVKYAIRQAMGQLLEYNHFPNKSIANKLIVVTKDKPSKDELQYLQLLRDKYKTPIYYQRFNMSTNRLEDMEIIYE